MISRYHEWHKQHKISPMDRSPANLRSMPHKFRGFTLTELAMTLAIIALLMGFFMSATPALLAGQKYKQTELKLSLAEAALIQFVTQNKRLPCPADGSLATGIEMRDAGTGDCTSQTKGVVPWVTLGLAAVDIEDGWDNRLTYRVAPGLTRDNAMDMSGCDPAGSAAAVGTQPNQTCQAGCTATTLVTNCTPPTAFLAGKGLTILDAAGSATKLMDPAATPSNGAAFVVISHGENLSGAYGTGGVLMTASVAPEGTNETPNRADAAIGTSYIDAPQNSSDSTAHFDDFVIRPSVMTVITRAMLGPRAHL
jgi:prepilin-type N-terminal cleavage/methylation domain-containing protein